MNNNDETIKNITKNINVIEEELYIKSKTDLVSNISLNNILLSLFHMRFNRLIGVNREKENTLMSYIENIIYCEERRHFYEKKFVE